MNIYEKAFSYNLRRFRKRLNMTQKMFADAAGYSEKTVSKWETEGALPSINTLFCIANTLHVDLAALFQYDEATYFLGIDGGGTKTAFLLTNSAGEHLRSIVLGGCNPIDIGIDKTKEILTSGLHQICEGIPMTSVVVFAGIAGCSFGNHALSLDAFFKQFSFAAYELGSDNENIIAAGLGDQDGITMIIGTGVCAYVARNHEYRRIAGWGYLFDEGGSGYNIGRDALSHYFSAVDRSGEQTSLVRRIEEKAGASGSALLSGLYDGGKKLIASYATLVFEEAARGDSVSIRIIEKNLAEIVRILRAALADFAGRSSPVPIVLAGGLTKNSFLLSAIKAAMQGSKPACEIKVLSGQPVEGAVRRAQLLWKKVSEHDSEKNMENGDA